MTLACPTCAATIAADDVNLDRMVAKCRACNAVFRFEEQLAASKSPVVAPREVPLPDGMRVERTGAPVPPGETYRRAAVASNPGSVRITRIWFQVGMLFLLVFAIAWDSFLVFWYSNAPRDAPWIFFVFPLAHVGVGVSITYTALANLLNRTVVTADADAIVVRTVPLPWWRGSARVATKDVRQLALHTSYKTVNPKSGPSYQVPRYTLVAVLADGGVVPLVRNLESVEQARFLEATIEEHLQIADDPALNVDAA